MTQDPGSIGTPSGFQKTRRFRSLQEQIEELRRAGASAEQIVAALQQAGAGVEALARAMKAAGFDALAVIGALQDRGVPLQAIAQALKKAGYSGEQVGKALSKLIVVDSGGPRWLRPEEIGKLLHGAGFEPKEIVAGLVAGHCPDHKIVDILVDAKVARDEIIKAMKQAGFSDTFIRRELERATGRPVDTWPVGKYSLKERAGL